MAESSCFHGFVTGLPFSLSVWSVYISVLILSISSTFLRKISYTHSTSGVKFGMRVFNSDNNLFDTGYKKPCFSFAPTGLLVYFFSYMKFSWAARMHFSKFRFSNLFCTKLEILIHKTELTYQNWRQSQPLS